MWLTVVDTDIFDTDIVDQVVDTDTTAEVALR